MSVVDWVKHLVHIYISSKVPRQKCRGPSQFNILSSPELISFRYLFDYIADSRFDYQYKV